MMFFRNRQQRFQQILSMRSVAPFPTEPRGEQRYSRKELLDYFDDNDEEDVVTWDEGMSSPESLPRRTSSAKKNIDIINNKKQEEEVRRDEQETEITAATSIAASNHKENKPAKLNGTQRAQKSRKRHKDRLIEYDKSRKARERTMAVVGEIIFERKDIMKEVVFESEKLDLASRQLLSIFPVKPPAKRVVKRKLTASGIGCAGKEVQDGVDSLLMLPNSSVT